METHRTRVAVEAPQVEVNGFMQVDDLVKSLWEHLLLIIKCLQDLQISTPKTHKLMETFSQIVIRYLIHIILNKETSLGPIG